MALNNVEEIEILRELASSCSSLTPSSSATTISGVCLLENQTFPTTAATATLTSATSSSSSSMTISSSFMCPCCGLTLPTPKHWRYIQSSHVAVAACVNQGFKKSLALPFPLKACKSCYEVTKQATALCLWAFPTESAFISHTNKGKNLNLTASSQSVIAVGSKTLRTTLEEVLAQNINLIILKNLPTRAEAFAVRDTVNVQRRMGAGFNLPGGVATVMSRRSSGAETLYTVSYPIAGGSEIDLPAALLSAHNETEGRRSSSSSSAAGAASSDARRVMDLQQEFDVKMKEMERKLTVERWQAHKDRQEAAGLREKIKSHMNEFSLMEASMKAAIEEGVKLEAEKQACLEELHKNVDEITKEAATANAGFSQMAAQLKEVQNRLKEKEKARKKAEVSAAATRNEAAANQARVLANVGRLLDEQKQAVEEEHQGEIQKHASVVGELREELAESQRPADSLIELAEKLGVPTEKRLSALGPRD